MKAVVPNLKVVHKAAAKVGVLLHAAMLIHAASLALAIARHAVHVVSYN